MKRIITMALAVLILIGCLPMPAQAAQTKLGMSSIGSSGYQTMAASQKMLDMLKVTEGFSATPYWDYAQWTIGYGCSAGSGSSPSINHVTPAEAEVLLKQQLKSYEGYVNNYCRKIGKQPSQNQFDALLSFTYNLGSSWMSGSRLDTWLRNPTTEIEFVNAIGQWVRAGDEILYALVQRRIREAIVFLRGEYSLHTTPNSNHNVQTNLPVIPNGSLPYFASVIYQYDYSTSSVAKGKGHAVGYFAIGGSYNNLLTPTRSGYNFAGWKITRINGSKTDAGTKVTSSTVVQKNLELTAVWTTGEVPDPNDKPVVELPFVDVPANAWYRESIAFVYKFGLMDGVSKTRFMPDSELTRGMLVTVLYRLDGQPPVTDAQRSAFDDIAGKYYTDAVAWAKANGIVNGVSEREFAPDAYVTRQEAVTIFYRYCVEYCRLSQDTGKKLQGFADIGSVSSYAYNAMQWAVNIGLINGTEVNNKLCLLPRDLLSRAETAAILNRCVDEIFSAV